MNPPISFWPIAGTSGNAVSPIVLHIPGHNIPNGTVVSTAGIKGNTAANVTDQPITVVDFDHISVPGTGNGAYLRGGVLWQHGSEVSAAMLTALDTALATRVTDKTGDTVAGPISLAASGGFDCLDVDTGGQLVFAGSSSVQTASGGRIQHQDGDDILLTQGRTSRSILVSMAELFNSFDQASGKGWVIDFATMGVSSAMGQQQSRLAMPLSRLHHGALLESVTVYFRPQITDASLAVLPAYFPLLSLYRMNPTGDMTVTPLVAPGAAPRVTIPTPASPAAYANTNAVGASGALTLATANGGSAKIATGQLATDALDNTFQVTQGGTFKNGAPVPVQAIAPSAGVFLGATTDHAAGDAFSWSDPPPNVLAAAVAAPGGTSGGLNAGYAQSITFAPYAPLATIDQSTYAYHLVLFDDSTYSATPNGWGPTIYTGVKFTYSGISSLSFQ